MWKHTETQNKHVHKHSSSHECPRCFYIHASVRTQTQADLQTYQHTQARHRHTNTDGQRLTGQTPPTPLHFSISCPPLGVFLQLVFPAQSPLPPLPPPGLWLNGRYGVGVVDTGAWSQPLSVASPSPLILHPVSRPIVVSGAGAAEPRGGCRAVPWGPLAPAFPLQPLSSGLPVRTLGPSPRVCVRTGRPREWVGRKGV